MLIVNNNFLFLYFYFIHYYGLFCIKTEINFYLTNVPTLLRCDKHGSLYYFNHFPTDNEFQKQILKQTKTSCDLSMLPIDRRSIMKINKIELLCEDISNARHISELIYFSSKCSNELCKRYTPLLTTIITKFSKEEIILNQINSFVHSDSSISYLISHFLKNRTFKTNTTSLRNKEVQTHQILFQYEKNIYLDMMCICQQYVWDQSNERKTHWSWICYYYPSKSEDPTDENMIYRAVNEYHKLNPEMKRILLREFENSSLSLNETKSSDSSKHLNSILVIMILPISVCGICYFYKKHSKNQLMKSNSRSSEDTQDWRESFDDVFLD
ncbi:hypothetical protein I4U23_009601 [Adineta vaga]|nr:hypothetical protein I4U23_009601 [Adineta vaga]